MTKEEYYINFAFEAGYCLIYKYRIKGNDVICKDDIEDALSSFLEKDGVHDLSYEDIVETVLGSFNIDFEEISCPTIYV